MIFFIKAIIKCFPFLWELVFGKDTSIQNGFKSNPKMGALVVTTVIGFAIAAGLFGAYVNLLDNYHKLNTKHIEAQRACTVAPQSSNSGDRVVSIVNQLNELQQRERGSK